MNTIGYTRLAFLDQLRAVAIGAVMILHYRPGFLPGGGLGVGLFFALSGFLIGGMLLEIRDFDGGAAARFAMRRFLRIYPPYLAAVLLTTACSFWFKPHDMDNVRASLPGLLTFTELATHPGMGFAVLWTLQVEMWFYLVLPIVMLALGQARGLVALSIFLIATFLLVALVPAADVPALLRWGAALALGALTALAWKRGWLARISTLIAKLSAIGCLGLFVAIAAGFAPLTGQQSMIGNLAAAALGCGMIAALLACPALPVWQPAAWFGRISYSLYLFHAVVLEFMPQLFRHGFPFAGAGLLTYLCGTITLALASYHWLERPAMRAAQAIPALLWPQKAAVAPATS